MNREYILQSVREFAERKHLYVDGCIQRVNDLFKAIDQIEEHQQKKVTTKDSILFLFRLQFIKPKITFEDVINAQQIVE
jgi:hypothetical protein